MSRTPEEIADLALDVAYERLTAAPDDFPAHALGQILTASNRMAERRAGGEEPAEVADVASIFEQLDSLPQERARELLDLEIARLQDLLAGYRERRMQLETGGD